MPVAVQADWGLVQQLYINGLPLREIREKTGVQCATIASRASRYGWKALAQRTKQAVQSGGVEVVGDTQPVESSKASKASALARERLSQELSSCIDTLSSTKQSKRLESQSRRASVVQTLAGAAKVIHGWSESGSQPAVRINILGNATIQPEPQVNDKPTIDLPTEPNAS